MPKGLTDYSNTIIYKLTCKTPSVKHFFTGHTTNLSQKKNKIKSSCNDENKKDYNLEMYKIIRENGGFDNWQFTEIAKYNCKNINEARMREKEHQILLEKEQKIQEMIELQEMIEQNSNEQHVNKIINKVNKEKYKEEKYEEEDINKIITQQIDQHIYKVLNQEKDVSQYLNQELIDELNNNNYNYNYTYELSDTKVSTDHQPDLTICLESSVNEEGVEEYNIDIRQITERDIHTLTTLVLQLINQNLFFKKLIFNQNKRIIELSKKFGVPFEEDSDDDDDYDYDDEKDETNENN
jgi:hypothetical protein